MTLITLCPIEQERDGGKGTREIMQAMREVTRFEIKKGREEQWEARRQMLERWIRPSDKSISQIVKQKYFPNQYSRIHYQNYYQTPEENLRLNF